MKPPMKPKARGARRLRRRSGKPAAGGPTASDQAGQPEERFEEPATPPRRPNVPVERPQPSAEVAEETEACGLPDEAHTPASDLH